MQGHLKEACSLGRHLQGCPMPWEIPPCFRDHACMLPCECVTRMLIPAGTPKGGLPSWDMPPVVPQPRPPPRSSSATPASDFPSSSSRPQPYLHKATSQPNRNMTQAAQSMAQPSWQGKAASSAADPFASMPAAVPQVSGSGASYQGSANDLLSDSLFSGLTSGGSVADGMHSS